MIELETQIIRTLEQENTNSTSSPEENESDDPKPQHFQYLPYAANSSKNRSNLNEANMKGYTTARFTYSRTKLKSNFAKVKD